MSPDECPNSPHIPASAHLLLSSVISTSLKSPFNLILFLCPGEWPPPPPPAQFSPPSFTPSPEVCPSSLCLGTLKLPCTWKAASQIPASCFWWLPSWPQQDWVLVDRDFQQYSGLGLMLKLLQTLFSTSSNPPASQHNWAAPVAEDNLILHPQTEIGLLRASNAQAHQSKLSTSHRVKTEYHNPRNCCGTVPGRTDSYQSWAFPPGTSSKHWDTPLSNFLCRCLLKHLYCKHWAANDTSGIVSMPGYPSLIRCFVSLQHLLLAFPRKLSILPSHPLSSSIMINELLNKCIHIHSPTRAAIPTVRTYLHQWIQ